MNRQPKLWEIFATFIPVFIGIFVWGFNLSTKIAQHDIKIETLEKINIEYRLDVKEMKEILTDIRIKANKK